MTKTPVLVIGGGPVGLSAALLLARFGISCMLVERETNPRRHPKARGVRTRTMELFRQWGIEDDLRPLAESGEALRFIYCDTLAGAEIARSPTPPVDESVSPTRTCRVPQEAVENALRERVLAEPLIDFRLGAELVDLEQDADAVTAVVRDLDSDAEERVQASYAIGADGVGSITREKLGIELEGEPLLARWQSIYWQGDIARFCAHRPCIQFLTGARSGAFVGIAWNREDRWVTVMQLPPSDERPEEPSADECRAIIRRAAGVDDLEVSVLDITTFRISAQVANRYRHGRVFLAGDAAHSMPPTGGFGMNTGVQDVHNLAWKLMYVIRGLAAPALLDTYEEERRPVAIANVKWSVSNARRMGEIRAAIASGDSERLAAALHDQIEHVGAVGQDLGFAYGSGAVVSDGSEPPPLDPVRYERTARPGHRAPHMWLERDGRRISTLDLFDRSFVLLAGTAGAAWRAAASEQAVPLDAHVIGLDLQEADSSFEAAYGIGSSGAVLVRPDGHVAWRSARLPSHPAEELARIVEGLALQLLRPAPTTSASAAGAAT